MDTRLLRHYERELSYIREMGSEFALAYPKIAARLGIDGMEVLDPYVERLLESFAFLSARVQLELELQYPTFTDHLLEIVYPHYLAPTPAMMVVEFVPDAALGAMPEGFRLPRHTRLRSAVEGVQTRVTFRTARDLTLLPIEIVEASYIDTRGELQAQGLARSMPARAAIRLRLRRIGGGVLNEVVSDRVTLFLKGVDGANWLLHEVLSTQAVGLAARAADRAQDWYLELEGEVAPLGFAVDEALLPTPLQSFDGYRLLQEYVAMPERFHFVELSGLAAGLARADGPEMDLFIYLRDGDGELLPQVKPEAFSLHAVPAINLFPKRCDRVPVRVGDSEIHVLPDRTATFDFEIYAIQKMIGVSAEGREETEFRPFYSQTDLTPAGETHDAYYSQRRRMRARSEKERLKGGRAPYLGSDVHVSLVDRREAPFSSRIDQLSVEALCTNRDLPMLLSTGAPNVFHLPDGGPVSAILTPVAPTRPRPSLVQGGPAWPLISHLSLNYLSITDTALGGGAEVLREMIGLYVPSGDRALERQIEGILSVNSRPVVRHLADKVLSTAVKGLEITLTVDESAFEGASPVALASVLEAFFRKYTTINSFTETVLVSEQRGEVARWSATRGQSQII